jgi:hypothetical protein
VLSVRHLRIERDQLSPQEAAADFRRKIAANTGEAMLTMAKRGFVTGGRTFGYDDVRVGKHIDRAIHQDEAAVIVRIFELRAAGNGYTGIAKTLNAERARCPCPQQGRPAGWTPSTIRRQLHDEIYRGVLVRNKTRTGDALESEVISVIIDAVFEAMQPEEVAANLAELRADLRELDQKIRNLTLVSAEGGADIPSVISQLRDWHKERDALLVEIGGLQAVNQIHIDRSGIEQRVLARVARWRELVESAVVSYGRQLLVELLEGPIRFTPDGKTYRFVGSIATGRLIAGMVFPPKGSSPTGFDEGCTLYAEGKIAA